MTGRTHDAAAVLALGGVLLATHPSTTTLGTALAALLANQIGGIAPDIDQPTAPFWLNLPVGGIAGRIGGRLLGGHRHISHSLVGVLIFGFLTHWFLRILQPAMPHINTDYVWYAFLIGYLSHLVMDSFTREGVPWLLPLPYKFGLPPLKSWRLVTGGKLESLILFPGLLALIIWMTAHYYNYLTTFVRR